MFLWRIIFFCQAYMSDGISDQSQIFEKKIKNFIFQNTNFEKH